MGEWGTRTPSSLPWIRLLAHLFQCLIVWSLETVLPARATPTTTLLIMFIIAVKFIINIIVTNEENVTTPTKDIANSTVNVTFILRLFCPYDGTIFSMIDCRFTFVTNVQIYAIRWDYFRFPKKIIFDKQCFTDMYFQLDLLESLKNYLLFGAKKIHHRVYFFCEMSEAKCSKATDSPDSYFLKFNIQALGVRTFCKCFWNYFTLVCFCFDAVLSPLYF